MLIFATLMERFINCTSTDSKYKQLFNLDPTIQFIEIGTFRCCRWLVPYNPIKFYEKDGLILCYEDVKYIGTDDLPLLHYYSRDMVEHSVNSIRTMFYNCPKLKRVDCSIWNLETVTDSVNVFEPRYEFIPVLLDKWPELLKNKAEPTMSDYKQLFDSDPNIKYIEIGTLRKCYWDTPYNPDKFGLENGKIRCKPRIIEVFANDLPLLHYYDRDMNEYKVTDISEMFYYCNQLQSADVSNWNVSKVTNMSKLFASCEQLQSIDVSNWNVSRVINMSSMFNGCKKLQSLNVSNWDISRVTDMSNIFANCYQLQFVDVSNWDVSRVTDMSGIFWYCRQLRPINVSSWNTSNAYAMSGLFASCEQLQLIDISNWNVSRVTDMNSMFSGCNQLQSLDVSKWNVQNVIGMFCMFANCSQLQSLNISNWNTSNVTNMSSMFNGCKKLQSLNVSNWNTRSVADMHGMFYYCPAPKPSWYKD